MTTNYLYYPSPPAGEEICDFCNVHRPSLNTIECESFEGPTIEFNGKTITFNSVGDWGACDDCKALIDADNWDEILERNMATQGELPDEWAAILRKSISTYHQQLRRLRKRPNEPNGAVGST